MEPVEVVLWETVRTAWGRTYVAESGQRGSGWPDGVEFDSVGGAKMVIEVSYAGEYGCWGWSGPFHVEVYVESDHGHREWLADLIDGPTLQAALEASVVAAETRELATRRPETKPYLSGRKNR